MLDACNCCWHLVPPHGANDCNVLTTISLNVFFFEGGGGGSAVPPRVWLNKCKYMVICRMLNKQASMESFVKCIPRAQRDSVGWRNYSVHVSRHAARSRWSTSTKSQVTIKCPLLYRGNNQMHHSTVSVKRITHLPLYCSLTSTYCTDSH